MQTDQTPFLERIFFSQESRAAKWGTTVLFASGVALFLSLFVIMVALGTIFSQAILFLKMFLDQA